MPSSGIEMVASKVKVSIIIPTFNEEDNVGMLHSKLTDVLAANGLDYEIIFIDDGSIDATFEKLQTIRANDNRVKIIRFKRNFGQSAAMAAGFDHALGEIVVSMDADLQNDPSDIPAMIEELSANGHDIICGWRYDRKDTFSKRGFSKLSNWLRRRVCSDPVHDSGCSLRVYRRKCLEGIELYGEMHRYIPALLSWKGYRIGEVKVTHKPRYAGKTKYNWQRLPKGFLDLVLVTFWQRYSLRPIHIIGGLGVLLTIAGAILTTYLIIERLVAGAGLADRPLFTLSMVMVIVGLQFLAFGVLADIMIRIYYGQSSRKPYVIEKFLR